MENKTNKIKVRIIPIAVKKKNSIIVKGSEIEYTWSGKILGTTICRTDFTKHVNEIKIKQKSAIIHLYRFKILQTKIKLHLIKALVVPIIHYHPTPLITASKNNLIKLKTKTNKKIQNKAFKFAYNEHYPYTHNTKTFHELSKTKPVSYTLYSRSQIIINKMPGVVDETFQNLLENYGMEKNHSWFPRNN